MKYLFNILALLIFATNSQAQIEKPVHWSYGTKKLSNGTIEVHLLATIDKGWHIYAQKQAEGAIATPTKITFGKNQGDYPSGNPSGTW